MGDYTLNTVKGHGFAVGDQVNFYGMGSDATPTEQGTPCVLTKQGNKYVLTYTATVKGDTMTWEFGPAAKIWASKVETVAVSPVAQGQTVHNVETDEVFAVAEVTPRSVSLRRIGTWRDGVTVSMVDIVDMINMGTLVIIGNPDDKRAEVETTTNDEGHGFSGHSRRPMQCRLCGKPAEVHSTSTDEGSSRQMWIKARTPLVTDQIKAWSGRTARVLEAIAELGGTVTAWDLGSGRGWHKTAVRIVMDSGVLVEADPSKQLAKTYVLSDMGRQACEWYGFKIAEPVKPVTVEIHTGDGTVITTDDVKARFAVAFGDAKKLGKVWSPSGRLIDPVEPIKVAVRPFSDRDMRDQIIAYLDVYADDFYVDGIIDHLIKAYDGAVDIDTIDPLVLARVLGMFERVSDVARDGDGCLNWDGAESLIWSGTGTLVKPSIRTGLNRRKRKATRRNRARVGGGF